GLSLSSTGVISGTPNTLGYYNFEVRAVDAGGVPAIKALSINIQNPLVITTTILPEGVLFEGYGYCLSASFGNGNRTWSIVNGSGAPPQGVTLQANGCFTGQISRFETASFVVQVTDQSSPPVSDTRPLSIAVSMAADQGSPWDQNQPAIAFGSNGVKIAERVITGVTGQLRALRLYGNSICPSGTAITAEIQGVASNGGPDGNTIASGSAAYPFNFILLNSTVPFAADETFTVVFSAGAACAVQPAQYDSYVGEGYVLNPGWQRLRDVGGRYDIGFQTLVQPTAGLAPLTRFRGTHTATVLSHGSAATN